MANASGTTSKIQLSPDQVKTLVAIILFCGVLGYFYYRYLVKRYADRRAVAEVQIAEVEKKIAATTRAAKDLPRLKKEIAQLKQREQEASHALPMNRKVPDILDTLNAYSRTAGITFTNITPLRDVPRQYYTEVSFQIAMGGTYSKIGRFMGEVAAGSRVMTVRDMNLTKAGDGSTLNASFTVTAYEYKN